MKILLADDHPMVRTGMGLLLKRTLDNAEIIEAHDYREALEVCVRHSDLDLVLLDLMMPGMDRGSGIPEIKSKVSGVPIVVISGSEDPAHVWQALDNGAQGYIPKTSNEEVIKNALRLILSGGTYLPPTLLAHRNKLTVDLTSQEANDNGFVLGLTKRQREVLMLLARGKSDKQIAADLQISAATVHSHVNAIFRALNVNNRTEAVHRGNRLGLALD